MNPMGPHLLEQMTGCASFVACSMATTLNHVLQLHSEKCVSFRALMKTPQKGLYRGLCGEYYTVC